MRPIELEVQGFTCFRSPARVDFRGLDLFAITGPTGAGKTSLIEAMIYALYGRSPRVSNEIRHLLSTGADKATVDLSFSIGKGEYRIIRTYSRRGHSEARLDQKTEDGKYNSLASGSRDVSAAAERLLGLDYEAFVKTVVLPQGRFDEFLKGQASDRQRILTTLLDFSIYEKMRKRASECLHAEEAHLKDIESRLAELGYATEEALKEEKEKLAQREEEVVRAGQEREKVEAEAARAREALALLRALSEVEKKRAYLAEKEAFFSKERETLHRARQAAPLVPLWNSLGQLAARLASETNDADSKKEAALAALQKVKSAEAELNKALAEAKQIPALEEDIARLREAVTLAQLLKAQSAEYARAKEKTEAAQKAEAKARREKEAAQKEAHEANQVIEALQKERARLKQDPEALGRLKEALRADEEFARAKAAFGKAQEALKRAEEAFARAEAESQAQTAAQKLAEAEKKLAEEALQRAHLALENARREDMVSLLRKHLRPGDLCPVCEGEIAHIPARNAPALEEAEAAHRNAQKLFQEKQEALSRLSQESMRAHAARAATSAHYQGAKEAFETADSIKKERQKELEEQLSGLRQILQDIFSLEEDQEKKENLLKDLVVPEGKKRLKGPLEAIRLDLEQRAERAAALAADILAAEVKQRRAEEKAARAEERLISAEEEKKQAGENEARLKAQVDDLKARLSALGDDPEAILAQKNDLREKLLRAVDQARSALALAEARARDAEEQAEAARKRAERAKAEHDAAKEDFLPRLKAAGFPDADALSQAALPEDEIARRALELASYDTELATLASEHARLTEALGDRKVSPEEVQALSQRAAELQQQERSAAAEVGALTQRIANLKEALARKKSLLEEEKKHRKEKERFGRLVHDLRSDEFQAFVLDEAFRFLAEDGSRQIHRLSQERYTFLVKDREFYVLDHWNAAEARPVRTLSGGETFLASLALSVALAERIHDLSTTATGDRLLESLFLDEGFGTLDADSLDIVLSALEELRTSGRMVGVISHVSELTARLPSRIVIERSASGSVLTQEGGG